MIANREAEFPASLFSGNLSDGYDLNTRSRTFCWYYSFNFSKSQFILLLEMLRIGLVSSPGICICMEHAYVVPFRLYTTRCKDRPRAGVVATVVTPLSPRFFTRMASDLRCSSSFGIISMCRCLERITMESFTTGHATDRSRPQHLSHHSCTPRQSPSTVSAGACQLSRNYSLPTKSLRCGAGRCLMLWHKSPPQEQSCMLFGFAIEDWSLCAIMRGDLELGTWGLLIRRSQWRLRQSILD